MPADELTKQHFAALKTMVEVASDSHPRDSFEYKQQELAFEGLNILLQHNPQFKPLSIEDQRLFSDVERGLTIITTHTEDADILARLEERLKRL